MQMPGWFKNRKALFKIKKIYLSKYIFLATRLLFLLFLYAVCRYVFFIYNADLFPEVSSTQLLTIFSGAVRFDLVGILYLNIIYFIAILIPFRFVYHKQYQNIWDGLFVFVNSLGIIANCFDIVYFAFTLKRTTGTIFQIFKNENNQSVIFFSGLIDYWQVTLFLIFLILSLFFLIRIFKIKKSNLVARLYYPVHSILLLIIIFLMISGIRGGFGRYTRPLAINNAGQYVQNPNQMALVLNTPFSILRTLRQKAFTIKKDFKSQEELERVFNPLQYNKADKSLNKKNVIILILESIGREYSGKLNPNLQNGNYKGYMPFLDSLMDKSLTFYNAYANGRKSIDGIPAILSGIPALKTHFVISNYATNKIGGLGHILKRAGYDVAFFHGAPNGSMGFEAFLKMAGIEKYFGKNEFNNDEFYDGTWGIWDEEFLLFMADEINNMRQPFSTIFFGVSSHSPFVVPERYKDKFKEGPRKILKTVGYTDYALKQFFKRIANEPWFMNTLFVITSDHATFSFNKEYQNHIGSNAIPLIFYTPDGSLTGEKYDVAQQTDIFPTIIDHLETETPFLAFGSSLLDSANQRSAVYYSRGSYKFVKDSFIMEFSKNKVLSLYNYISDPLLAQNLSFKEIEQKNIMENQLKAIIQQYTNRMINNEMVAK